MLREIKTAIDQYLKAKQLADLIVGEYTEEGLKITSDFVIPKELLHVPHWLQENKENTEIESNHKHEYQQNYVLKYGDNVYCLRAWNGKIYFVLDVMK